MALPAIGEQARKLVAAQKEIPEEQLTVVTIEEVTWSDSSLGCPQPGRQYLKSIREGVRIIVEGKGKRFYVHGDAQGRLFICDNPRRAVGESR
ncbi:MAG: hypothetical protein H0T73_19455 [Ardenticatenales bacterium]|nr:hypothetical protein [Ardenticatenales bacterium]